MSVEILNGLTVKQFMEDGNAFNKCVEEHFKSLDINGDGVLSHSELRNGIDSLLSWVNDTGIEKDVDRIYDIVFEKFDTDHNGTIDPEEFATEMKKIMLAVASGIGELHVQVVIDSDSFLMKAVQYELPKNELK